MAWLPTTLSRASLSQRIAVASGAVALVLVAAFVPLGRALESTGEVIRAAARLDRAATQARTVLEQVIDLETGARGFILTRDDRFLEPWYAARKRLPRELRQLRRLVGTSAATPTAGRVVEQASSYLTDYSELQVSSAQRSRSNAARSVAAGEGKRRVDRLRRDTMQLVGSLERQAASGRSDQEASERRGLIFGLIGLGLSLLLVVLFAVYLRRSLAVPICRLNEGADRLRSGQLTARVPTDGPHELAGVAESFNAMAASLQSSHGKLETANEELGAARGAAEDANRAKSEFLSRMSHELRTPLNSVLGFGQLLQMDGLDGDQRQSVDQIVRSANHLLELINEVLDISRIEAGEMSISSEPVQLQQAVDEAVSMMLPAARQRDIAIEVRQDGVCDQHVRADQQRLRQVLLNLLSNAVKYNRSGGSISLRCPPGATGSVRLSITDTGPGLSPVQRERLFEPFDRLGAERGEIEGTGLGLALSKRLTELMGGSLWAESQPGEGTTLWLELRAADNPVAARPVTVQERSTSAHAPSSPLTVLYIEDNTANLQLVEQALARLGPVELLSAMHAGLGIELAVQHRPQLILLDLHLPDLPGEQALGRLKAEPATQGIPVVILSADATERQIERMLARGAAAYLTKPLDLPRFFETVGALIETRVVT